MSEEFERIAEQTATRKFSWMWVKQKSKKFAFWNSAELLTHAQLIKENFAANWRWAEFTAVSQNQEYNIQTQRTGPVPRALMSMREAIATSSGKDRQWMQLTPSITEFFSYRLQILQLPSDNENENRQSDQNKLHQDFRAALQLNNSSQLNQILTPERGQTMFFGNFFGNI